MEEGWNFTISLQCGCYVVTHHNLSVFHLHGKQAKITAEKHICSQTLKLLVHFPVEDDADT